MTALQLIDELRQEGLLKERGYFCSVTITPHDARQMLTMMGRNRKVSYRVVDAYARDMASGKWIEAANPICFDISERLFDGQHRLYACIKSGVPFKSDLAFGLPHEAMWVTDVLRPRRAADNLWIADKNKNAIAVAALATAIFRYRQSGIKNALESGTKPSVVELFEMCRTNPRIHEVVSHCTSGRWRITFPRVIHFAYYLFSSEDQVKCDEFFSLVIDGAGLVPGDPALTLRNRLFEMSRTRAKLKGSETLILMCKAWIAHIQGRKLHLLRYMPTENLDYLDDRWKI